MRNVIAQKDEYIRHLRMSSGPSLGELKGLLVPTSVKQELNRSTEQVKTLLEQNAVYQNEIKYYKRVQRDQEKALYDSSNSPKRIDLAL